MFIIKIEYVNDRRILQVVAYISGVIALATLLLLAISLNGLRLDPGVSFPLEYLLPDLTSDTGSSEMMAYLLPILRVIMILSWILLPFCIVYLILSKQARKQLIRDLAMILPVILILYFFARFMMNLDLGGKASKPGMLSKEALLAILHLPDYTTPPPWINTSADLLIAVAAAFIFYQIVMLFWKRRQRAQKDALAILSYEVQTTLTSIETGGDLRNAITVCYLRMVEAIREYRQLSREKDMTPQEFESYLELCGIPHDPLHRLTMLFEKVRYGSWTPSEVDEQEALESLSLIIEACQSPRTP